MKPAPNKPAANGSSLLRKLPAAPALKTPAQPIQNNKATDAPQNTPPAANTPPPRPPLPASSQQGKEPPAQATAKQGSQILRPLPGKPPVGSSNSAISVNGANSSPSGTNPALAPRPVRPLPGSGKASAAQAQPTAQPTAQPPATQAPETQPASSGATAPRAGTSDSKVMPRKTPSAINIPASTNATSSQSPNLVSPRSKPAPNASSQPASTPPTTTPTSTPIAITTPTRTPLTQPASPRDAPATTPPTRPLSPTPADKKEQAKPENPPEKPTTQENSTEPSSPRPKSGFVTPFVPTKPAASVQKGFEPSTSPLRASNARLDFGAHRVVSTELASTPPVSVPAALASSPATTIATPAQPPKAAAPAPALASSPAPKPEPPAQTQEPAPGLRSAKVAAKRAMSPPPTETKDASNYGIRPNSELRASTSSEKKNNTFGRHVVIPEPSLPYSFSSSPPNSPTRYGTPPSLDGAGWIKTSSDGNDNTFASKMAKTSKSFTRPPTALYDPEVMNQTKDQLKDAVRAGLNHMALELLKGYSGLMRRATIQKTTHVQCRLSEDSRSLEFSVLEKPQNLEKLKIHEIGRDTLLLSAIESVEPALEAKDTAVAAIVSRDRDVDPTCCIAMYLKGKPVGPESPIILVASTRQEYATYYDGLSFVIKGDRRGLQVETEIDIVSEVLAISEIYSATVNSLPLSPPPMEA